LRRFDKHVILVHERVPLIVNFLLFTEDALTFHSRSTTFGYISLGSILKTVCSVDKQRPQKNVHF
jgi:hypothetical protein